MNEELTAIILTTTGAIISTIIYIALFKFSNKVVRMFQLYAWSQDALKLFLRIASTFISAITFLLFLRRALIAIELKFTVEFIEKIILNSGKYLAAVLIIMLGVYISRKFANKLKETNQSFNTYIYIISSLIINTAFILTALTIIEVNIIVFLEVYKIILLSIGITFALIIGIPIGTQISNKINKKKSKK
jgi:uncharacterized protein YneF (UPF0154 family)